MTSELFVLTCCMLLAADVGCSPVSEETSTLNRPRLPSIYPAQWPRRLIYSRVLRDPAAYDADYATDDDLASSKRSGNGAWIWMPAQGYVSVSKNQQASAGDAGGKHGRIMRYGK